MLQKVWYLGSSIRSNDERLGITTYYQSEEENMLASEYIANVLRDR